MEPQRFGRYELLAELGRGGMAELWLARLVGVAGFAKLVAIKRILPHLCDDKRFVEMFLAEGRVTGVLSHPNICQVYELGDVDGRLFLAMELLEGVSWEQFLTVVPRGDASRVRLAAGVLGQASDGLHYAHDSHGIVHRDVSPQNLFVTVDGVCKVLDFGVAKVMSEGTRTSTGMLKGKLPYMSPEQIKGEAVDPRADVFALGIVLWEALTGQRLFSRETDYMVGQAVVGAPIPPVSAHVPFGAAIDAVVARALAREVGERFPTIAALSEALRDASERFGGAATHNEIGALVRSGFAETLAERARRVTEASGASAQRPASPAEPTVELALRDESIVVARKKSRRVIAVTAAVAVAGGAAAVIVATRHGDAPARPAPPAPVVAMAPLPDAAPPPPDAAPAPEIAFTDVEVPRHKPARHAVARPASTEPGFYSVDSTPYATIFVDGKRLDQTPLFHVSLPAGAHQVRAVLADGRQRTFTIQIAAGAEATSGTLIW